MRTHLALQALTWCLISGFIATVAAKPESNKPPSPASASLPPLDLILELRQMEDTPARGGYTVGSERLAAPGPLQTVRVRNGEKAHLRLEQTTPASSPSTAVFVSNTGLGVASSSSNTGAKSGQALGVTPRWPGGKADVRLEIDWQTQAVGGQSAADQSPQNHSQLSTTVTAPMGIWVIISASGGSSAPQGSYGSEPGSEVRRTVQVRVSVP